MVSILWGENEQREKDFSLLSILMMMTTMMIMIAPKVQWPVGSVHSARQGPKLTTVCSVQCPMCSVELNTVQCALQGVAVPSRTSASLFNECILLCIPAPYQSCCRLAGQIGASVHCSSVQSVICSVMCRAICSAATTNFGLWYDAGFGSANSKPIHNSAFQGVYKQKGVRQDIVVKVYTTSKIIWPVEHKQ